MSLFEIIRHEVMSLFEIIIREDGEHWDKTVRLFGIPLYHRHDYAKDHKPRPVGFVTFPDAIVEVEDEFDCDEEDKKK